MVKKTDWAYLAGIIDGEGSICINRAGSTGYVDKWHPNGRVQLRPEITVVNTDKPLIEWIIDLLAEADIHCKIKIYKSARRKRWKRCYYISIVGFANIEKLAEGIRSHMKIKAKKLELLEEFICLRQSKKWKRLPYTKYEWQIREAIRAA